MKRSLLVLALLAQMVLSAKAHAEVTRLNCKPTNSALGTGLSIDVDLRVLAPAQDVVSITLLKIVIYPGAQPQAFPLTQYHQDAKSATFFLNATSVELDKVSMTATISHDADGIIATCSAN